MTTGDYCAYPPRLAPDVEVNARADTELPSFIAGSASVGRYLILGVTEHRVMGALEDAASLEDLGAAIEQRYGAILKLATLQRFLSKLDEVGMLAGGRRDSATAPLAGGGIYVRFSLGNPDALFARLVPRLRWIWTASFVCSSVLLTFAAALMAILYWPEFSTGAEHSLRNDWLLIFAATWIVTILHELAHGLTSKVFGGRATELGVLLVYYCLPALYCNVSGLHMIPQRSRRLWVIAAGLYFQAFVGVAAMLIWFVFHPQTWLAQVAMAFVLGSLLDIVFNANPLIKLDGYYFLSQWLRIPNLMDRSQACWRSWLSSWFFGGPDDASTRFTPRERHILLVYGLISFLFRLTLPIVIVWIAAQYLMDWFEFNGLVLASCLAIAYLWKPLRKLFDRGVSMPDSPTTSPTWRRFIPYAILAMLFLVLIMPWTASVGSYGTLLAIPGREAIIRAPESASLLILGVEPGQRVAHGATLAQMGNLDVDEEIAGARTELARASAEADRLSGELLVQRESTMGSEWEVAQRGREFEDLEREQRQIRSRLVPSNRSLVPVAAADPGLPALPPALAALESEVEQIGARQAEANHHRDRARRLAQQGILARSELDSAEARAGALSSESAGARERLGAALIDHQRRHMSASTQLLVARSSLSRGKAQASNLALQRDANLRLRTTLEARLGLLERKRGQFKLTAPLTGIVFGDDLPRMVGQYFKKGSEICRLTDIRELLVRVQVAEQALGDVRLGQAVRLKTRTFSDRVFGGIVSKIGGESELDANGQRCYRVELTIQNEGALLKPGMTVFSRVDFGTHPIGWLLVHKLKQALRPELWML